MSSKKKIPPYKSPLQKTSQISPKPHLLLGLQLVDHRKLTSMRFLVKKKYLLINLPCKNLFNLPASHLLLRLQLVDHLRLFGEGDLVHGDLGHGRLVLLQGLRVKLLPFLQLKLNKINEQKLNDGKKLK